VTAPTILERVTGYVAAAVIELESRRRHYAPPPDLTCSQWADRYRQLSRESSAEPGRWRTSRRPYLREIMDACSDPAVERVTFQKPAQIGWTEIIGNVVGFYIDQDPSPILVIQPTLNLAQMWSKERFDPMLRDTPQMWGRIREGTRREKDQSILRKAFPGGFIAIAGANSAAGLRARPIRILIGDERDGYPITARGAARANTLTGKASGEGDPFGLAIKRTTTFWNRKILEGSTPTTKGQSAIESSREQGSDAQFFLACPRCGWRQTLRWGNLKWDSGDPDSARYVCGDITEDGELTAGCGEAIYEYQLPALLADGVWVHKHPERRRWRSFWINGLYCVGWADLIREWLSAQGKPEDLKVFINTRLAETWEEDGEGIELSVLEARREDYSAEVPMECGLLTAAVDVQGDRLEYQVKGWAAGEESCLIKHEALWGDPAQKEVWDRLTLALFRDWKHESGVDLQIRGTAIDSGGHHTDQVYRYCKSLRRRNVFPIKGIGEPGRHAVVPPQPRSRHRLWTLGTIALKDIVFARLQQDLKGPGYMHFPKATTKAYLEQLTSEKKTFSYVNRKAVHTYILQPGRRNEALDLECYSLAALYMLGSIRDKLGQIAEKLKPKPEDPPPEEPTSEGPPQPPPEPPKRPRGSSWATGGGRWGRRRLVVGQSGGLVENTPGASDTLR
jgi:phage terminase large subunit GpA-like protein